MRERVYKLFVTFAALLINVIVFAQTSMASTGVTKTNTADIMRSNGKIYVVMAVCITILTVLVLYVIRIDIKVTKLEKASK